MGCTPGSLRHPKQAGLHTTSLGQSVHTTRLGLGSGVDSPSPWDTRTAKSWLPPGPSTPCIMGNLGAKPLADSA